MKTINAPLCKSCAIILLNSFNVDKVSDIGNSPKECPWCQRKKPDAIYILTTKHR